jgi:pimeloyl-ACP methyl ester carboxylesterase
MTPLTPILKHVQCLASSGFHNLVYAEWGDRLAEKVLICVHGFSRNGRDFDELAKALVGIGYRVICPDMPGRGASDWLTDLNDYSFLKQLEQLVALMARLDVAQVDWIGTSMGGLTGMILASFQNSPIRNLVLNDIGPFIQESPLKKIKHYLGFMPPFKNRESAQKFLKKLLSPFGTFTPDQWDHMTTYSFMQNSQGEFVLNYDPKIVEGFDSKEADLWDFWKRVTAPTLVIRGENSEILEMKTVERMLERDTVTFVQFPNAAHAPALMAPDQIKTIITWLQGRGTFGGSS